MIWNQFVDKMLAQELLVLLKMSQRARPCRTGQNAHKDSSSEEQAIGRTY